MAQPVLSIVIPVYNAQRYLRECFDSILRQSYGTYEVVIVNDGSVDESEKICREYAERDDRFRWFTTENKGVSHARNFGMKKAAGEWILFLDSDDYLLEESLKHLMSCTGDHVEEVCANYHSGEHYKTCGMSEAVDAEDVMTMILDPVNNRLLPEFYHLQSATLLGVWGKLFRRKLIEKHQLHFDESLKLSEDMLFHLDYLSRISKVHLSDCPVFYYRQHEESVTRNFKEENLQNRIYLFEQLEKNHRKDPVFVISTMLQLAGHVEQYTEGNQRKVLRRQIRKFWKDNQAILKAGKNQGLSVGKWQNKVYQLCVRLLLWNLYSVQEAFLNLYVKIS